MCWSDRPSRSPAPDQLGLAATRPGTGRSSSSPRRAHPRVRRLECPQNNGQVGPGRGYPAGNAGVVDAGRGHAAIDVDTTPPDGQPAADESAVTTRTVRLRSLARSTRLTRTPENPKRIEVPLLKPVASRLLPSQHPTSRGHGPGPAPDAQTHRAPSQHRRAGNTGLDGLADRPGARLDAKLASRSRGKLRRRLRPPQVGMSILLRFMPRRAGRSVGGGPRGCSLVWR